jgi:hypothetical protein
VNSKFGGFGIQTGPIPPIFVEFRKIRPIFLTLLVTAADQNGGKGASASMRARVRVPIFPKQALFSPFLF